MFHFTDPSEEGVVEQLHKQLFVERENVRQLRQQNEQDEKVATVVHSCAGFLNVILRYLRFR